MKISYIVPGVGLDEQELERRRKFLNAICSSGSQIDVLAVTEGPLSIESYYDEFISVPETLKLIVDVERRGYDAGIIGCYGDPGIDAARELVRIPVVGPGESAMLVACCLAEKFSIITVLPNALPALRKQVRALGLESHLASVRSIGIPVLELRARFEEAKKAMIEEGSRAIDNDDAHALILGCMSEGFLGVAEEMSRNLGVPVVNPVKVSVKMAELLVGSQLTHSPLTYMKPPPKAKPEEILAKPH